MHELNRELVCGKGFVYMKEVESKVAQKMVFESSFWTHTHTHTKSESL